jgi:perosamine synthetase
LTIWGTMSSITEKASRKFGNLLADKLHSHFAAKDLRVLHEPVFRGREEEYTRSCIASGFVSSVGQYVNQFEEMLVDRYEGRSAVATNSGTSALHLALLGLGVKEGDEVLIPAATFVATANAVRLCGALPHFVDINLSTMSLDSRLLSDHLDSILEERDGRYLNRNSGRRISALIVVHLFGHPAPIAEIQSVLSTYGIPVVEDAAEAVGSEDNGRPVGTRSSVAALSFNGNKIVTSGGGGAVVCENSEVARLLKHLSTTAKVPHPWRYDHDMVGFNYRMPNINAAIGCAQLEQLDSFVEIKRSLYDRYSHALSGVEDVVLLREPNKAFSNYWLQTIMINSSYDVSLILETLHERGIGARPLWTPLHELPMYRGCDRTAMRNTESLSSRLINLPSGVAVAG